MTSTGILAALGVSATASGNIVTTTHGAFIVTQECIATPLIPVYVAGALAVPLARWQRVAALGAAPAIFFLLGVARLLVLALPTTLVASHTVAIHAFSQVLVAGLLVAGLAVLSARSVGRQHPARRAVGAIGVGIVAALAVGGLWSNLMHLAVDGGQLLVQHGGHRPVDDPQGAIAILPALQLGLYAAFCAAVGARGPWRRLVLGVVGLAGLQLTVLLMLGELSHHLGFAPHVSLIRAWGVVAPLAVVWVLRRPRLTVSPPAPVPDAPAAAAWLASHARGACRALVSPCNARRKRRGVAGAPARRAWPVQARSLLGLLLTVGAFGLSLLVYAFREGPAGPAAAGGWLNAHAGGDGRDSAVRRAISPAVRDRGGRRRRHRLSELRPADRPPWRARVRR